MRSFFIFTTFTSYSYNNEKPTPCITNRHFLHFCFSNSGKMDAGFGVEFCILQNGYCIGSCLTDSHLPKEIGKTKSKNRVDYTFMWYLFWI